MRGSAKRSGREIFIERLSGERKFSKKVLIVDDEEGVREIVGEMIADLGYATYGAASAEAALSFIARHSVDLVISDVKMSGIDGLTLVRHLRKRFPELPVALMTAYPNDDVRRMLQDKLVDCLLPKPFLMSDLQGMVQRLAG